MVRNVLGAVIAALGAAVAVWSPFAAWYDGRLGRDYALTDLFSATGITGQSPDLFASLLLPYAVAAAVALVGIVLRLRLPVAVAGLLVLAFTVLWMVREGQAQGSLTVNADGTGLNLGVARAFGGGMLLLLGALVMRGRHGRGRHVKGYAVVSEPDGEPYRPLDPHRPPSGPGDDGP